MDTYRVKPGAKVNLLKWDANDTSTFRNGKGSKSQAREAVSKLNAQLETLQEMLYAERKHKILVVLQAMDTGGKDGVIRSVFDGVNPQGVRVASFGVPTPPELSRDYLWRIHQQVPAKGEIVIFNRSHYEDVLVVRVNQIVPEEQWRLRYDHIREWERLLAETGTTILKFFLHIDRDEQRQRLQERLDDPTKHWKFRIGDLDARAKWDEYMAAFAEAISKTSTDYAPWHIVPANKKWYRDWVISNVIVDALKSLGMTYPESDQDLSNVVIV
jgi:PPK2 family polyphosphate:nucleotide phosphotransferase